MPNDAFTGCKRRVYGGRLSAFFMKNMNFYGFFQRKIMHIRWYFSVNF